MFFKDGFEIRLGLNFVILNFCYPELKEKYFSFIVHSEKVNLLI